MIVMAAYLILIIVCSAVVAADDLPSNPETPGFAVCRLRFESDRHEPSGTGWKTDYPLADRNLMMRLGEFTRVEVARSAIGPAHRVVTGSDPALMTCPVVLASDAGTMALTGPEQAGLRTYLAKGGFVWSDDTWGPDAWEQLAGELGQVWPWAPLVALPADHLIFRAQYVAPLFQMPHVGHWHSHQTTSERGEASATPIMAGIHDRRGRLIVLVTHNTDIADAWEQEADPEFFEEFAAPGYALAINIVLYALSH